MQQAHMVQQVHEMQHTLHRYDFEGDNFVDAFGAAQRQHVQCSNCNTYEIMLDPLLLLPSVMFKDLDSRLCYMHLEPDNSALMLHDGA